MGSRLSRRQPARSRRALAPGRQRRGLRCVVARRRSRRHRRRPRRSPAQPPSGAAPVAPGRRLDRVGRRRGGRVAPCVGARAESGVPVRGARASRRGHTGRRGRALAVRSARHRSPRLGRDGRRGRRHARCRLSRVAGDRRAGRSRSLTRPGCTHRGGRERRRRRRAARDRSPAAADQRGRRNGAVARRRRRSRPGPRSLCHAARGRARVAARRDALATRAARGATGVGGGSPRPGYVVAHPTGRRGRALADARSPRPARAGRARRPCPRRPRDGRGR